MSNRMRVLSRRLGRLAAGFSFATVACFSIGLYAAANTERPGSFLFAGLVLKCLLRQLLFVAGARLRVGDDPREACRGEEACRGIETCGGDESCGGDETRRAGETCRGGEKRHCGGEETCGADEARRAGETCRGEETCRGDETCRGEEAHGGEETYGGEGDRLRGSSRREIHHHWKARLLTLKLVARRDGALLEVVNRRPLFRLCIPSVSRNDIRNHFGILHLLIR